MMFLEFAKSYDLEGESFFRPDQPIYTGRAPGRLDVMGGIADYSGSLVLEMPIAEGVEAAVQRQTDPVFQVVSVSEGRPDGVASFSLAKAAFGPPDQPLTYESIHQLLTHDPEHRWVAYVLGAIPVLRQEKEAKFPGGAKILLRANLPEGKGVSSSAAVEVATMQAVAAAYDIQLEATELALLCQMVENHIAGAPCGIMDQMTVVHGRANQLLALLCQPAEIQGYVDIPDAYAIWGLDSGIRHAVSGADYGSVRVGAFMGLKMLQTQSGATYDGYLARITPALFEQHYRSTLPVTIKGQTFLDQYGALPDAVTTVDPERTYAVRQPTAHPIYEHFRVQAFARLLTGAAPDNGSLLGELMYQAHASYSACGLGSDGTDLLVDLVRGQGIENGLFGAKITGGGSGGTVAILGRADARPAIARVVALYARLTGHQPYLFSGSTNGAMTR